MITIELPDGTKQTAKAGTIEDILRRLELNPYEILVLQPKFDTLHILIRDYL